MSYDPKTNPEGNPWTRMAVREQFDNAFITHSQHDLKNHLGNPVEYTIVHFKNRAVGVVPYEDGYVHLVGQYRYAIDRYSWELPEGGCPPGKETLDAAKWELAEESGLRAERFDVLLTMHTSNAITDEFATIYLATGLTQGQAAPEENEVLQNRKIALDDLIAEVESGKITDSLTVAAVYKLAWMDARGQLDGL